MAPSLRRRARAPGALRGIAALSAALASLASLPSRAEASDDALVAVIATSVMGADTAFLTYDLVMVGKEQHPILGWALGEVIVGAPQALILGGLMIDMELANTNEATVPAFAAALVTGSMTAHGIFSMADSSASPAELFLISPILAANSLFTAAAIARLFTRERVVSPALAVTELVLASPPTIYLGYRLGTSEDKAPWIGLMAWSGAIVLHGAVSLFARDVYEPEFNAPVARPPFSIKSFGPAAVGDRVRSAPGFMVAGTF